MKIHYLTITFVVFFSVECFCNNLYSSRNMKFCANLSFLFADKPFLERYKYAKEAGFKGVESGFPTNHTKEEVAEVKNAFGLQQVLLNAYAGDPLKGELGFAAIPGREKEFRESILTTIEYAKELGTKKIHIMAGNLEKDTVATAENDYTYESNLKFAARLFEKENILGLIEPINKYVFPRYYMNSFDKAIAMLDKVNSPHMKLMLDVFHLQMIQGHIATTIREVKKYIGHVQVGQAPYRNEPSGKGEINYSFVFEVLESEGYKDWVGLEYKPDGDAVKGLKWIKDYGYSL